MLVWRTLKPTDTAVSKVVRVSRCSAGYDRAVAHLIHDIMHLYRFWRAIQPLTCICGGHLYSLFSLDRGLALLSCRVLLLYISQDGEMFHSNWGARMSPWLHTISGMYPWCFGAPEFV